MNLDIRKNDNSSIIQSRSCDNLCVQSETVTPCEMKRLQTEKQFSDDLGYFNKQNYLSFSTCSSASTDLNFEELTNRLDEIKQKYTENNTSKIVDILSECIYKEADDVDDITTVNSTKHNLLYTTVT